MSKRRRFMKQSDVLLIDKNDYHLVRTELHRVASGNISPDKICIPISKLLGGSGVDFLQADITGIDPAGRTIETSEGTIPYDALLVATGSEPEFFRISSIKKTAFTLKDIDSAVAIRERLESIIENNNAKPQAPIVVAGAGATGVEVAAYIRDKAKEEKSDLRVILIEKNKAVLAEGNYSPRVLRKVRRHLEKLGVEVMTGAGIKSAKKTSVTLDSGEEIKTSMLIWTAGVSATEAAAQLGRGKSGGRQEVRPGLNLERYPEIFVAGDAALTQAGKKILPCSAQYAIQEGALAATNIVNFSRGKSLERYAPDQKGEFISIGNGYAVGWIGVVEIFGHDAQFVKDSILASYLLRLGPGAVRNFMGI